MVVALVPKDRLKWHEEFKNAISAALYGIADEYNLRTEDISLDDIKSVDDAMGAIAYYMMYNKLYVKPTRTKKEFIEYRKQIEKFKEVNK